MQIKLTRDSVLGTGKIEYPQGVQPTMGDASRSGLVTALKCGKKGEVHNLPDGVAFRLIQLGSATFANPEDEQKKKAA
jgi:hypothetical protein